MEKITEKYKKFDFLNRCAYIGVFALLILIPFTGLVLESFNIHIITANMLYALYIFNIALCILTKNWKLLLLTAVGSLFVWALTMGMSEVLWYYLKAWFGIDISYR